MADCTDLAVLQEMLEQKIARGKKQRIKKKIQALKNPEGVSKDGKKKSGEDTTKLDAKQRVELLLRKRDEKLQRKEDKKKTF